MRSQYEFCLLQLQLILLQQRLGKFKYTRKVHSYTAVLPKVNINIAGATFELTFTTCMQLEKWITYWKKEHSIVNKTIGESQELAFHQIQSKTNGWLSCLARSTLHAEPVATAKQTVTYTTAKEMQRLSKGTAETLKGTLCRKALKCCTKKTNATRLRSKL